MCRQKSLLRLWYLKCGNNLSANMSRKFRKSVFSSWLCGLVRWLSNRFTFCKSWTRFGNIFTPFRLNGQVGHHSRIVAGRLSKPLLLITSINPYSDNAHDTVGKRAIVQPQCLFRKWPFSQLTSQKSILWKDFREAYF